MIQGIQPGEQLDHYHIECLVARGGMASLFRGTDSRSGRAIAIKVPNPEMECDVLFFDRFKREAEIGRRLNHPGVVKVLAQDDPSRVYMAMEWVEGLPLRQILDNEKKINVERAGRIAIGICDALEYIHNQGVVHRDLKPDNILVDTQDRIKLIDFGIACDMRSRRLTFGKLTKAMGTPDYVSPEQVKGKRGDARSDIYSLGIMLYEMVTGEVPFGSVNALTALNLRVLNNPTPPREMDPNISPELQEIIYRALERDPEDRYQTAREFALDLQHPEEVGVAARVEQRAANRPGGSAFNARAKLRWSHLAIAMIPIILFALLFFVANQK
jgi:eukaryotic-like serine/threonine-protein kinase